MQALDGFTASLSLSGGRQVARGVEAFCQEEGEDEDVPAGHASQYVQSGGGLPEVTQCYLGARQEFAEAAAQ